MEREVAFLLAKKSIKLGGLELEIPDLHRQEPNTKLLKNPNQQVTN